MNKASAAEVAPPGNAGAPPLPDPGTDALFLDYDGTLVGIAPTPDAAVADDELRTLLADLDRRWGGAVALVSGRQVADLDRFLAPLRLTVAGLHGLDVRLRDGTELEPTGVGPVLERAKDELRALQARIPGTMVEDKRFTVAFHFRGAPAAAAEAEALAARLVEASEGSLQLLHGKMVVEILPAGRDKGRAIVDLLGNAAFAGRRPVFLGDDITDEAGFSATNERGGISARIGSGDRGTAARWTLPDVAAARAWLHAACRRAGGGGGDDGVG